MDKLHYTLVKSANGHFAFIHEGTKNISETFVTVVPLGNEGYDTERDAREVAEKWISEKESQKQ